MNLKWEVEEDRGKSMLGHAGGTEFSGLKAGSVGGGK